MKKQSLNRILELAGVKKINEEIDVNDTAYLDTENEQKGIFTTAGYFSEQPDIHKIKCLVKLYKASGETKTIKSDFGKFLIYLIKVKSKENSRNPITVKEHLNKSFVAALDSGDTISCEITSNISGENEILLNICKHSVEKRHNIIFERE